jgi:hypothetical protein
MVSTIGICGGWLLLAWLLNVLPRRKHGGKFALPSAHECAKQNVRACFPATQEDFFSSRLCKFLRTVEIMFAALHYAGNRLSVRWRARSLLSDCPDDRIGSRISSMHQTMAKPKPPSEMEDPPLPADPVIEAYKKDVDRTLLRQSLKMTVEERIVSVQKLNQFIEELQRATRAK